MKAAIERPVVIIGGTGDIGTAIVSGFRDRGHRVIATDRQMLDLADLHSIDAFLARDLAPRDLVFAAATNCPKLFLEADITAALSAIEVNFASFLRLAHVLLPRMTKTGGGAVTVISSLFGKIGRAGRLPYATSKHALIGVVQTLAIELGAANVRVNAVTPGFIDTKLTRKNILPDQLAGLTSKIPLGRLGLPQDVADAVLFLHSDKARYITGQDIVVDGGFIAGGFMGI